MNKKNLYKGLAIIVLLAITFGSIQPIFNLGTQTAFAGPPDHAQNNGAGNSGNAGNGGGPPDHSNAGGNSGSSETTPATTSGTVVIEETTGEAGTEITTATVTTTETATTTSGTVEVNTGDAGTESTNNGQHGQGGGESSTGNNGNNDQNGNAGNNGNANNGVAQSGNPTPVPQAHQQSASEAEKIANGEIEVPERGSADNGDIADGWYVDGQGNLTEVFVDNQTGEKFKVVNHGNRPGNDGNNGNSVNCDVDSGQPRCHDPQPTGCNRNNPQNCQNDIYPICGFGRHVGNPFCNPAEQPEEPPVDHCNQVPTPDDCLPEPPPAEECPPGTVGEWPNCTIPEEPDCDGQPMPDDGICPEEPPTEPPCEETAEGCPEEPPVDHCDVVPTPDDCLEPEGPTQPVVNDTGESGDTSGPGPEPETCNVEDALNRGQIGDCIFDNGPQIKTCEVRTVEVENFFGTRHISLMRGTNEDDLVQITPVGLGTTDLAGVSCTEIAYVAQGVLWIGTVDGLNNHPVTVNGGTIPTIAVSSDGLGNMHVLQADGHVAVVRANSFNGEASLYQPTGVMASDVDTSRNGDIAFITSGYIFLTRQFGGEPTPTGVAADGGLDFNPDGSKLLFHRGEETREYNMITGEDLHLVDGVYDITVDPKGSTFALAADGKMYFAQYYGDPLVIGEEIFTAEISDGIRLTGMDDRYISSEWVVNTEQHVSEYDSYTLATAQWAARQAEVAAN